MTNKIHLNKEENNLPRDISRCLIECEGYLELNMLKRAKEILESLPPAYQNIKPALLLNYRIEFAMANWERARDIAKELIQKDNTSSAHWVILAAAERRAGSIERSITILEEASLKFPECAVIFYNLACYYCQTAKLAKATQLLQKAFRLDVSLTMHAVNDPDLKAIKNKILLIAAKSLGALKPKK